MSSFPIIFLSSTFNYQNNPILYYVCQKKSRTLALPRLWFRWAGICCNISGQLRSKKFIVPEMFAFLYVSYNIFILGNNVFQIWNNQSKIQARVHLNWNASGLRIQIYPAKIKYCYLLEKYHNQTWQLWYFRSKHKNTCCTILGQIQLLKTRRFFFSFDFSEIR
jgi:hypothetical protein